MLSTTIVLFLCALAASSVFTAMLCRYAPRLGLVDTPDARRKIHRRAVPLGGGLAIFGAVAFSMGMVLAIPNSLGQLFEDGALRYASYFAAGLVIVVLGLIDDRAGLRGRVKLLGQIIAALILICGGLVIHNLAVFHWSIQLGLLSVPFTLFWLVGAINALNLLDGIDGMATTVGLILVSAIAVLAGLTGSHEAQIIAIAFAGGLVGFLRHNFPPAKIFLGDAGSMLIGLVVGGLAIEASLKGPGTVLLAAPLAICSIPILDSAAAILRRKLTGRSIYSTDRGHLHHRLLNRFGSNRRVLFWVAMICAPTAAAALASVFLQNDAVALVTTLAVIGIVVAADIFGRAELLLLVARLAQLGGSLFRPAARRATAGSGLEVRLQGSRSWGILWESLTEAGDRYGLSRIHLNINMPAIHENYVATWKSSHWPNPEDTWSVEIPLKVDSRLAGRLEICGERNGSSPRDQIEAIIDLVEQFESRMASLSHGGRPGTGPGERKAKLLVVAGTNGPR
ncbi:MAG: MraY family glycosyltransferase [Thermoguttaceae bacterium]|jgi:UDP-GlcNAc:undecaprenyl-phosphate GlcNAc-1-phosphate transferase